MTVDPIPTYYVREDTLAGPLYFWPKPAVKGDDPWHSRECVWLDDDGNRAEVRGNYVITRKLTAELIATWTERTGLDHYRRLPMDELSEIARGMVASLSLPSSMTPQAYRDGCKQDGGRCGACTWCTLTSEAYQVVLGEPIERRRAYPVGHLELLDIATPDPAPDRTWVLASPNLAALYPSPSWHQFPGRLTGVFADIAAGVEKAVANLPDSFRTDKVSVYDHNKSIYVLADIPWDEDLPVRLISPARSKKARDENFSRQRAARMAIRWQKRLERIPDYVTGATKAEALAKRDELVAEYIGLLVPPHSVGCSACKGMGYIR